MIRIGGNSEHTDLVTPISLTFFSFRMSLLLHRQSRLFVPALICRFSLAAQAASGSPRSSRPRSETTAADLQVSGRITDEKGEGIAGANVIVKGGNRGTQTAADGRYRQSLKDVVVIGYGEQSRKVVSTAISGVDGKIIGGQQ